MKEVVINETDIVSAANEGMDSFLSLFVKSIKDSIGGELTAETMPMLNVNQITLLAYDIFHEEVMDGGFVQLIHNGYGGFIFQNPFAKVLKMWGLRDLSKLIYNGREWYFKYKDKLEKDCSDEELLLRYRFTRRQHPMIVNHLATTLEDAIEVERDFFDNLQENSQNTIHIDTTKLSTSALASRVLHRFKSAQRSVFTVTFQSFGFKHGVPLDADMVIDVRFLPNPFYDPLLRDKTGNQKEVYDYVMDKPETQEFIVKLKDYCDFVFSQYEKQNKSHMIVAIGCTGGQHRSVSICNWLYDAYKDIYRCFKSHRDIGVDEE